MSRVDEFLSALKPYQDALGFVGGHPVPADAGRQSDNAGCFTAEAHRIASDLHGEPLQIPSNMGSLLQPDGRLHRYPGDPEPDLSPDNYLGFLNWVSVIPEQRKGFAEVLLQYGISHFGNYGNSHDGECYTWRQPQLLCAVLSASGRLHALKFWQWPLVIYTALVIAVAGRGIPAENDQDARRLSWHLIQIMKGHSLLCRLAARIWWKRLRAQYGGEGMRLVFGRYFNMEHPFARFAVNEWEMI